MSFHAKVWKKLYSTQEPYGFSHWEVQYNIRTHCKDSFHCERLAIVYALYKLKELNINNDIIILSDNRDIVNEFASKYHSEINNIAFGWIPRRQNTTAHHLAKNAAKGNIVRTFVPKQILQMIYK